MNSDRIAYGENTAALSWVASASEFYGLSAPERFVLGVIATWSKFKTWDRFRLCIAWIMKAVGFSRATVNRALARLRGLHLISYDGQIHVGKRRPVAAYRVSGTPEVPLPEWVIEARDPERDATPLTCALIHRSELNPRVEDSLTDTHLSKGHDHLNPSAPLTKTGPQAKAEPVGDARRGPHLPPATRTGAVRAAKSLLGRFRGNSTVWGLGSSVRLPEPPSPIKVPKIQADAVRYSKIPTVGGTLPTLFANPTFGALSRDARLTYLGIRELAETEGQVSNDLCFLKSQIFPYDDHIAPSMIEDWINELTRAGKIHRTPGSLVMSDPPGPSGVLALFDIPAATKVDPNEAFDRFWATWPKGRRQGKGAARKAFLKHCARGVAAEHIVAAAAAYGVRCQEIGKEVQFIPHPATWLNGERYDDDPEEAPQIRARTDTAFQASLDTVEYYRQLESGDAAWELGS